MTSDPALQKYFANRAVALLKQAKTAGYLADPTHLEALKKDTDFGALRQRPDFQELIDGRQAQTKTK